MRLTWRAEHRGHRRRHRIEPVGGEHPVREVPGLFQPLVVKCVERVVAVAMVTGVDTVAINTAIDAPCSTVGPTVGPAAGPTVGPAAGPTVPQGPHRRVGVAPQRDPGGGGVGLML